ncbi:immunoglobulin superfamily member 2 isoform X2 [Aquila chrysaetos chrysaetos]|uniref:immunoglobulin superfamily member 2 isoform X2 n=1 Tax=Aquila chrysaetos chrysaetos TaxID=223781 RepID=UPI001B7D31B4|nr:immunoglobulin superfamily member 2 isoform X2 [Aquila chrysaetos chrysaetos]
MGLVRCPAAACLLLLLGLSTGQRVVTVQKGPLYRVRGSHITLWCKVSGYQGPAEQNFQWSIYLPSAPEREVQIVSTVDPSFPYAIYTQRVRSRGIYVERVQGDAVLLHITELQDRDAGEYECHTPNTDERYFGSYSAKMNLSVIADTLSASMAPQVLTHTEGDAVELTCEVSKSTAQHTHLSVGWYHLQEAGDRRAEEVLTLSKDFVLRPGPSYVQRFLAGDVRLNKVGNTTYKLSLGGVELSDRGQLYCEAAEWIEDPDETWKDISRKQTARTSLAVMSQGRDLSMDITAAESSLSEGDTLQLNCTVGAQKSSSRHFQVLWLLNGMEVARVDPHGILIWEEEYEERAKLGHLRAFKQSNTVYVLTIYEVGLKDNGTYHCSVSEVNTPGDFHSIQTKLSSGIQVNVKPIGLGLHATLTSRIATVKYGQSFELVCQVSASYTLEEVPASVGWLFQPSPPTGHYHELVRVFPSGTVAWGAAQPRFQGKAQLTKAATSFRLSIHNAAAADEGTYQCEVEVWRKNTRPLGQPAATTRSNAVGIKLVLPESKLRVATKESSVETVSGADTAIECRIMFAQNNSQFAITWYLLPSPLADATPLQILRANYSSILEYGAEFSSPAQKSRFLSQRVSSNVFWLRILSANPGDQGRYYCVVEEWLWLVDGWYKLGEGASGSTMLEFKLPGRELQLEKTNRSISVREGEEVTLHCLLRGAHLPATHLSATWFRGEESRRVRPLLTLHHDGAIEYPVESLARRLHLRRPTTGDFSLTLRSVEEGDAGVYHCQVQEWQQQSKGKDWALQALARSGYTRLTTIPPESTVLSRICSSPPLLNFILYLPLVLILLLALVVFCLYFKFGKSKKGKVTGDQLMELQGAGGVKKT